ncbi:MAG: hypothetical protein ABIY47_11525 [Opitutaceae bacterium]
MPDARRSPSRPATLRFLQTSLVLAVASFAWLRFAENTVDNDLWGHVLYGQRYWNQGYVRGPELFSWTAGSFDIVNHEYLAEIFMGLVHRAGGGTGIWLYLIAMASATVAVALWAGNRKAGSRHWPALLLFGGSINFIALGFAVRPQLFTTLFLVVELFLLRHLAQGRWSWGLLVPPLIALWGNLHGGVLAGLVVFGVMAAIETLHAAWPRSLPSAIEATRPPRGNIGIYWGMLVTALLAMAVNPWGVRLVEWNIRATFRARPQIHEWQPLAFSPANAPFFLVLAVSVLAWIFSRQPKKLWEAATLVVLAVMGMLHQRHTPLFGLANVMFSPIHLADAARRLGPYCRDLVTAFRRPLTQIMAAVLLLCAAGVSLVASFSAPKENPFTMEVERNVYPVTAVEFLQTHRLAGKTITFFDWGQQNLWELPDNPVSFDGRFDTGYPAHVIAAHWAFYNGTAMSPDVKWHDADVALLPSDGGGVRLLVQAGWRAVYRDPLATLLVSPKGRQANFRSGEPMERHGVEVLRGRKPFPDSPPSLATAAALR